jgi:hypothetical protein
MEGGHDETQAARKAAKRAKVDDESYEALATSALSRARSMLKRAEPGTEPDPMVDFMLQSAQVLATLELAAAIRSVVPGSDR